MVKFLKNLLIVNWLRVNGSNLTKILIYILLTLAVSYLYRRWEALLLLSNPEALLWLLTIYTIFLFIMFFRIYLLLRKFIFLRVPRKAVLAKKSFINKPDGFDEIADIRLRPKLYSRNETKENNEF